MTIRKAMNLALMLASLAFGAEVSLAGPMTREEFLEAVKGSYVTEMGSFGTNTGDERKFGPYICENWRTILTEFDSLVLLKKDSMHGLHLVTVALACEELEPMEYLDFLDEIVATLERKKAKGRSENSDDVILYARGRKNSFLAVNWKHPRVQSILQRAINVFSDIDPGAAASLQAEANGELAEEYMGDRGDDDPLPETLSGIKLKRPWASLLKKYELLTGKKSPHDSFEPRDQRRGAFPVGPADSTTDKIPLSLWPWIAACGFMIATASFIWIKGMRRKH